MNYALILAAGVGQRMRSGGLPKQFLKLYGKPIIVYTLEKFEENPDIKGIVLVCKEGYVDHMKMLVERYSMRKVMRVIVGGSERQGSLMRGLEAIRDIEAGDEDVVVIHDGVRPLVSENIISENIRVASEKGAAMTVHPVTESVTISNREDSVLSDFKKRADTYSLTAPQSFRMGDIMEAFRRMGEESKIVKGKNAEKGKDEDIPLLDAAMVYAKYMGKVAMVKDMGTNIKVTTPEDFYFLRSMIEMEENKFIFGL